MALPSETELERYTREIAEHTLRQWAAACKAWEDAIKASGTLHLGLQPHFRLGGTKA